MNNRIKSPKVCLLGATFETNNMGVGALTYSSIKCIAHTFPDARITLLDYGKEAKEYTLDINGKKVHVELLNLRFSKKLLLRNNIAQLLFITVLTTLIPSKRLRDRIRSRNLFLNRIKEFDIVAAISGGDSFSDIYGLNRFFYVTLPQLLVILAGKKLILLPQTIGPFKGLLSRVISKYIMNKATTVYSRDSESSGVAKSLLGNKSVADKVRLCYDVAFVLDPKKPGNMDLGGMRFDKDESTCTVGLNVSGLLFAGGYTQNNMFGLKVNYKELVYSIIELLIETKGARVILTPHVFGTPDHMESDSVVCTQIYDELKDRYKGRLFIAQGMYNQNEIKYIIGLCDFFIGSRMHSCIAAISQSVPAVAVAYSRKFQGVMESIELPDIVVDPRSMNQEEIIDIIEKTFDKRADMKKHLDSILPGVKERVLNLFNDLQAPDGKSGFKANSGVSPSNESISVKKVCQ